MKKRKLLNKKNTHIIISTFLFIVAAIFFMQMLGKAERAGGYDFTSYLLSAKALLYNHNPYLTSSPFPYIYPLFLASVLIPLTFLPYIVNNIIWFIINIGALCLTVYYLNGLFYKKRLRREYLLILFLAVIFLFNPIQNNFLNGQVNFLVILLSVLYFYNEEQNSLLSCFFLSAAISIKIVPLIFVLYTVAEKKYRELLWITLFSFIFMIAIPFIFTGFNLIDYYNYYLRNYILISFSNTGNPSSIYFTLYGFIKSIFIIPDSFRIYFQILLTAIILLPVLYVYKIVEKNYQFRKKIIMLSLLSVSILLISPSSETHHLVFLIAPIIIIIEPMFEKKEKDKIFFITCFILVFVLFWAASIFKLSLLFFLSIISLYFIILFSIRKIGMPDANV